MSDLAWGDPQPNGPTCRICGEPLRLDLPEPHVCGTYREVRWGSVLMLVAGALMLAWGIGWVMRP
jgi:hypothetical protein